MSDKYGLHGRQVNYKLTCLQSFKTVFLRKVNEGVRIACCGAEICLNSNMQFHQPANEGRSLELVN